MQAKAKEYETTLDPTNPLTLKNAQNEKYKGFKDFLLKKVKSDSLKKARNGTASKANSLPVIRAAFYTPWTANTSYPDLKRNADKLNTIFPEWFFIDTIGYKLNTRIDTAGLALMKQKQLRIMPMLSNYSTKAKGFDGNLLHKILSDSVLENIFIKQIADTLSYYNLSGINVDFEELTEPTNGPLTEFQKKLYAKLHGRGMLVSMDVEPKNNDYDYTKLSDYNDYLVLMAYDQFNNSTGPGPISSQKWIEDALSWTAARITP
jgi:spore germination protein YaaH